MAPLLLSDLPPEIIIEICRQFCNHCTDNSAEKAFHRYEPIRTERNTGALICMSLTCRRLNEIVTPFIYHDFDSGEWSQEQSILFLYSLCKTPKNAAHVKRIALMGGMYFPGPHWKFFGDEAKSRGMHVPRYWKPELEGIAPWVTYPRTTYPNQLSEIHDEQQRRDVEQEESQEEAIGLTNRHYGGGEGSSMIESDRFYHEITHLDFINNNRSSGNNNQSSNNHGTDTSDSNSDDSDAGDDGYHQDRWWAPNKHQDIAEAILFGLFVTVCSDLQHIRLTTRARTKYASILPKNYKASSIKSFYLDGYYALGSDWIKMTGTFSRLWTFSPRLESVFIEGCNSFPSPINLPNVRFLYLGNSFPESAEYENLFSSFPKLEKFIYGPTNFHKPLDLEAIITALHCCKKTLRYLGLESQDHPSFLPSDLKDFHELRHISTTGNALCLRSGRDTSIELQSAEEYRKYSVSLVDFLPPFIETLFIDSVVPGNNMALVEFEKAIMKGSFPRLRKVYDKFFGRADRRTSSPYLTALQATIMERSLKA